MSPRHLQHQQQYRTFDGKPYKLYDLAFTKPEAIKEVAELRSTGHLARRIKTSDGTWLIYTRKINGGR